MTVAFCSDTQLDPLTHQGAAFLTHPFSQHALGILEGAATLSIFLPLFTPVPTLNHTGSRPYKAAPWFARDTKDMFPMQLQW